MPYTIRKSDGFVINIADDTTNSAELYDPTGGSIDTGMGIQLIGRNKIDYGAPIAQNFLQMTENFASATGTQPVGKYALQGQLWYDKSLKNLYIRITDGTGSVDTGTFAQNWQQVITVGGSGTSSLPIVNPGSGTEKNGDMKVVGTVISIWSGGPSGSGGSWKQVWPAQYS
jgi:hypothetical protein